MRSSDLERAASVEVQFFATTGRLPRTVAYVAGQLGISGQRVRRAACGLVHEGVAGFLFDELHGIHSPRSAARPECCLGSRAGPPSRSPRCGSAAAGPGS